jgi:hypothetical protein
MRTGSGGRHLAAVVFSGLLTLSVADAARAALIQPDTAVASTEFSAGFDGLAVNTINGSGLPSGFGPGSAHAPYASGNHWTTLATSPPTQFITWGFSAPQTLDEMYVWNHQSTSPPAGSSNYDVTLFDLTLRDAANNVLLFLDNVSLAPDTATGQTISFGGPISGISSVLFDIEASQSNGATPHTGLAEVAFNTVSAIPEPSTHALILTGAALLGVVVRHLRRAR